MRINRIDWDNILVSVILIKIQEETKEEFIYVNSILLILLSFSETFLSTKRFDKVGFFYIRLKIDLFQVPSDFAFLSTCMFLSLP